MFDNLENVKGKYMSEIWDTVLRMSYEWWESKRPVDWTLRKHAQNATINCVTKEEKHLAKAIARCYDGTSLKKRSRSIKRVVENE